VSARTVLLDYPADDTVAAMQLGGMSVVERLVREAARAGAQRVVIRAAADRLPTLPGPTARPPLTVPIERLDPGAIAPAEAEVVPADVVAGVRITDEASRRRAWAALLQSCRRPYDGLGDRYVGRAMSLRLTRVLLRLRATPNQVTVANIVVGLAACVAATVGTRAMFALAGALIVLQVVLDSCDGELARLRHMYSKLGMWLDNLGDDVVDNLFVACLGIGLGGVWAPVAIAAAAGRGLVALMIYVAVARAGQPGDVMAFRWWFDKPDDTPTERFVARMTPLTLVRAVGRRDLYTLVWGASCLATVPAGACGLGIAICVAYVGMGLGQTVSKGWR
jgi:phosphatidylglycerophosphate synthase